MSTDVTWGDHDISLTGPAGAGSTTLQLTLCDGRGVPNKKALQEQPNPRTAIQVNQGGGGGDGSFEMPYTPIGQKDWSGGRGLKVFDKDASRYYDGNLADTSKVGMIMPAGKSTQVILGPSGGDSFSGATLFAFTPHAEIAFDFVPSSTYTCRKLILNLGFVKTVGVIPNMTVTIRSDNAGSPDTVLALVIVTLNQYNPVTEISISTALTSGTKYWIVMGANGSLVPSLISYKGTASGRTVKYYAGGGVWTNLYTNTSIKFEMNSIGFGSARFFEFKGGRYCVTCPDDASTPAVYMNGYRGILTSGTKSVMTTALTLAAGTDLTGKIFKIVGGTGYTERQNWRRIISNTTGAASTITVSPSFRQAEDGTTEFVIIGTDTWTALSTPGITLPLTCDPLVLDDIVYFCQGAGDEVRRMKYAAGTHTWADEGTVKRDFMAAYVDATGKRKIVGALAGTSRLYTADPVTTWTDLTWADGNSGLAAGSTDAKITGLGVYGDPQRPWFFKEDSFGDYNNNVYAKIPLGEMRVVRSENNGVAHCQSNRFLYFSMGEGIERYYQGQLDDIGPNKDDGLPEDRRGPVVDIVPYPGGILYAAIDAGETGYSSVVKYNGNGWCEVFRGSYGSSIRKLWIETIPGLGYQKLWITHEETLYWIPIAPNPLQVDGFEFTTTCSIETGWMFGSYRDVFKFWNSLKIFHYGSASITAEYQVDGSGTWNALPAAFTNSPSHEQKVSATNNVAGICLRFRITITTVANQAVYIDSLLTEVVTRMPVKMSWPITFLMEDLTVNDQGLFDAVLSKTIHDQLLKWANSDNADGRLPVAARFRMPLFDTDENGSYRYMFVEPSSVQPIEFVTVPDEPDKVRAIGRCTLIAA